jgi:sugar O-acyltransferase (sialic acid O-acetyltransferase NeuD family)
LLANDGQLSDDRPPMAVDLLVYGAGGSGRETAWLGERCGRQVGCLIEDGAPGDQTINDLPVLSWAEARRRFPRAQVVVGVGSSVARERITAQVLAEGADLATLVHPEVERSRYVEIGAGTVICAGCILSTNLRIGAGVQVNIACTISHDAIIEDWVTFAPGVHVAGRVHIGRHAYVGTGVNIINGTADAPLTIGAGAIIGAGACVVRSIPAGVTAVGVPARPRPFR